MAQLLASWASGAFSANVMRGIWLGSGVGLGLGLIARPAELPRLNTLATRMVPAVWASEGGARIIDGKAIAAEIRAETKVQVDALRRDHGVTPGLAVVLVGQRTDSATYVRMKKKAAEEVGFHSVDRAFPESVTEAELLACVEKLNGDAAVRGAIRRNSAQFGASR